MKLKPLSILVLALLLPIAGCGDRDPGPSKETQEKSSRLDEIQRRTGGDWSKLSKADHDFLVNELSHGSEATAKMLLGPPVAKPGGGKR